MQKKNNLIYLSIFFIAIAFMAFFVFLNMRSYIDALQKSATYNPVAENMTAKASKILENDMEELAAQEETEETKTDAKTDENETDLSSQLPDYVPIARSSDELAIGFITDLHVFNGSSTNTLAGPFTNRIYHFVKKMNNEIVPDFILINGDVIEGTKIPANTGIKQLQLVKNIFNLSKIQKYWVLGNHDLRSVTKQQWQNALGINYLRKSFELRNYKIIILDSNFTSKDKNVTNGNGYTRGHVSSEELRWLEKELKNTKKKTIIFIHHTPLLDVGFESKFNLLDNADELRKIFAKHDVLAVFSGHIENLYYEKDDGVQYFSLPGVYKNPKYPGAFGIINVKEGRVDVNLNYLTNGKYTTINVKK